MGRGTRWRDLEFHEIFVGVFGVCWVVLVIVCLARCIANS
jgi:hypothetical protein